VNNFAGHLEKVKPNELPQNEAFKMESTMRWKNRYK
jgi:hypothetical protein